MLYQQLAKCFLMKYQNIRFRYEPYLWSITEPSVRHLPFSMEQLSSHGTYVHKSTPLLLRERHSIHDEFTEMLFGEEIQDGEASCPEAFLTKTIRGAGRLESYLKRFPDLKVVACLRNPIDTINSCMGLFSFLGNEFHSPDEEKLVSELKALGRSYISKNDPENPNTLLENAILWWRSLTQETLRVAKKYPENVHLFVHERYRYEPEAELDSLTEFLPLVDQEIFQIGSTIVAGPKTKNNYLLASDVGQIFPHLKFYLEQAVNGSVPKDRALEIQNSLLDKVANTNYTSPIIGENNGTANPVTSRGRIPSKLPFQQYKPAGQDSVDRIPLADLVAQHCAKVRLSPTLEKRFCPTDSITADSKTFGCIITCHNNFNTILDSIVSALDQTRPFDQIVVVNDASTDGSTELLEAFANKFHSLQVLNLDYNVGVSAARHLGILQLQTDFITQLDGDDCFWPTKNYHEAEIVLQDENAIAFSDILIVTNENHKSISTSPYECDSLSATAKLLLRDDGVPRDMTFARKLYFAADGYDFRLALYEDLDFKIRLAQLEETNWRRSEAACGTIYNRKKPIGSRNEGIRLQRAITEHYFRYVDEVGLVGREAAEAFRDLHRNNLGDWGENLFERLFDSSIDDIRQMKKTILSRQLKGLSDKEYVEMISLLCLSPSFNAFPTPWKRRHGVAANESPHAGYDSKRLHWQTEKNCGFILSPKTNASGVRGLLYLPHLAEQKLNVVVEQKGKVVQRSFVLEGRQTDAVGNHCVQEVEIPINLTPGEAKISCFADSSVESDRTLYCLFADWQLYC